MREADFIKRNIDLWSSLELKVNNFYKDKKKNYSKDEIDDLIIKYNQVMNHLAYSRSNYGNNDTTEYLNKLASSAHAIIYSSPKKEVKSLLLFFLTGFPRLFRKNIKYFVVSTSIFLLAALASFLLVANNIENIFLFFEPDTLNLADESTGPAFTNSLLDSSIITTNNIYVSFFAFALGISLGLGTAYVLIVNGFMLGSLAGIFLHKGQSAFFWSLILPHGIPELFAIFVCGAAGLLIGYSLINPGKMSRKDALLTRGKEAIQLVIGCIPILIIAGIIEGYFTPLPIDYIYKFFFSIAVFILLIIYIALPGKKPTNRPE